MSGKIEVKVRQGRSKDPRRGWYPYWYLEIEGEDGNVTTITPTYNQIKNMLVDILVHELRVDYTRKRNPDLVKWREFLKKDLEALAQHKIDDFRIPEIYLKKISEGVEL